MTFNFILVRFLSRTRSFNSCQKVSKDGAENALCSNISAGPIGIYEVKRSQRHLLAAFEKIGGEVPI